jgi:hypothetical protein
MSEQPREPRRGGFPRWGVAGLPVGALGGALLGAIAGGFLGSALIGAAIGAALGVGLGMILLAAAVVTASSE